MSDSNHLEGGMQREPTSPRTPLKVSSATRRKIQDDAVDMAKQEHERNCTFWQRYRFTIIIGIWSFLTSLSGLSGPFLFKIKADQLGGDQRAGEIQSIIGCVAATLGMFTATIFGQLVDSYGRRPFFIISSVCNVINSALLTFLRDQILISMISGGVTSLIQASFVYAAVADVYSTKMRIRVLSILFAIGSFSSVLVIVTNFLSEDTCFYIAFGSTIVSFAFSFLIPETLEGALERKREVEARLLVEEGLSSRQETTDADALGNASSSSGGVKCENPFSAMKHLTKSKVMIACTVIACFYSLAQVGTGDVYMFYLAERVGFTASDNAYVIMEAGIVEPLVYVVVLPLALRYLSPVMIIILALVMLVAELVVIATVYTLWPIYAVGVPFVALAGLLPPVVTGTLQNSGDERDQGRRMAGIQAFTDFADALGPLFFGLLFGNLKAALVFLPFVISAGLAIVPMIIALRLNKWAKDEREAKEKALRDDLQQQQVQQ